MRRAPRNLRIAFDHSGLTHFGGAYFFHEFLQVLWMRRFLAREMPYHRRNHRYSVSQMLLALVPDRAGPATHRNRVILAVQRRLSVPHRPAGIPRSADLAL